MNANFIDYIKVHCRSGKGGAGSAHLRREKFVPKGGPDGGDGGRGGHIILRGNRNFWTLLHLKYTRHLVAEAGAPGGKQQSFGAGGKDVIVDVPLGTVVKDGESREFIGEITEDGQTFVLLSGGKGGLGNVHFKSSTRQTPRYAQPGEPGQEQSFILELKLLADVGLVGFPNAGKSTLLSVVSAAKPEIADYPFTTLVPNLGMVPYRDDKSFVMADIPGIIEDAHKGRGLGHRFLRHIERNALLLFLIPSDSKNIADEYGILLRELKEYNPELLDKHRLLAVSKCDLMDEEMLQELKQELTSSLKDVEVVYISSHTQMGIMQLKDKLWLMMNEQDPQTDHW
ncbi:MAG: GTPase ObgE [Bacteroidales bacterium]|nr:GTPase ObgE [Bacteroidales bacterium]